MAQSKTKYKYDLNIVCGCDEDQEPNKVVELREYLVSRHNFKIYGKPQHEVGKTIFKTHGIGIEDCRYTILWMTKDDYKDDPVQTYYRQNALARLTDAEPKPNGTERMLILLEGISRNDYLANNPEFKQFNVQSVKVDLDWKQEIEKVLKDREVFCHDDKQPSNTESGGEQDYPPVTPSRVGEPNPAGLHGAEQYPSGEQCRGNHGSRSEDTLSPKFNSMELGLTGEGLESVPGDNLHSAAPSTLGSGWAEFVSKHLYLTNTRRPAPGEQWFSKARPSGEGGASLPLPEEKKPVAAVIPVAQGPEDILDGAELQRREDDPRQDMEDDPFLLSSLL